MENLIKMDDVGVLLFEETTIYGQPTTKVEHFSGKTAMEFHNRD